LKLADDLTCAELVELVTGYLDGALGEHEKERFEEHLVICRGCDIHLSQMRETLGVVGRLTEDDVGPDSAGTLLEVFRDWKAAQ
jgi:Putative zinc-finger